MKPVFYSGLLFIIVGLVFSISASSYSIGTASRMGPGYFPVMLGAILVALGIINLLKSLAAKEVNISADIAWRPMTMILLANILFGVLLPSMGLVVAIFALVIVSSYAMPNTQIKETLILALILSIVGYCVFAWALSMPVQTLPAFKWISLITLQ